jgi:hypothetical protein
MYLFVFLRSELCEWSVGGFDFRVSFILILGLQVMSSLAESFGHKGKEKNWKDGENERGHQAGHVPKLLDHELPQEIRQGCSESKERCRHTHCKTTRYQWLV